MIPLQDEGTTIAFARNYQVAAILRNAESIAVFDPTERTLPGVLASIHYQSRAWGRSPVEDVRFLSSGLESVSSVSFDPPSPAPRVKGLLQSYRDRLWELEALAEEEGLRLNPASIQDFWRFIGEEPFLKKGSLVLLENGNPRLVWRAEHGSHVGLQFLGEGMIQFVIFRRRTSSGAISRIVGRDNLDGVRRQLEAFDLRGVLSA